MLSASLAAGPPAAGSREELLTKPADTYRAAESVAGELGILVTLATPVAVAQVGMLTMGLVDTWMVGRLGTAELGAVALGDSLYFTLAVVAMGILGALDPMISQAHGAGDHARCAAAWHAGRRLALLLALPLTLGVLAIGPTLGRFGDQDPGVVTAVTEYLSGRCLAVLPQLWFFTNRSLLNGLGSTRPAMVVTVVANLVNVVLDWALIFGAWGFPALGVAGSGIATAACRVFMFAGLAFWLRWHASYRSYTEPQPVPRRLLASAFRLGLPIGLAHGLEVGAFGTSAILMGLLGVVPLASHTIALKMAATSFMVAVALGIATSIRVGNGVGARSPEGALRSAWVGLGAVVAFMGVAAVGFAVGGATIMGAFSDDARVVELGAKLLLIAAAFQLFDGAQAVASGALRGSGDTVRPLVAHLVGHWGVAIPVGATAAFGFGLAPAHGAQAIWWGLASGLAVAAALLLIRIPRIGETRPLEAAS